MPDERHSDLFWRIVDEHGSGPEVITLVMQDQFEDKPAFQLETALTTRQFRALQGQPHVDVAWTDDDFQLLQSLLEGSEAFQEADLVDGFRLDLSSPMAMDAIAIIATARFGSVFDARQRSFEFEWRALHPPVAVGDSVSLALSEGLAPAVVVALDSVEAEVVLLDIEQSPRRLPTQESPQRMMVYRGDLLAANLTTLQRSQDDPLH